MSDDQHLALSRGTILAADSPVVAKVDFLHVSAMEMQLGAEMSSEESEIRPHYEFFRPEPRREFLSDSSFLVYRKVEEAFERMRLSLAPDAPSRSVAIFCFVCPRCAVWFRESSRMGGFVFEVTPMPGSLVFVSDLVWRNIATSILKGKSWQHERLFSDTPNVDRAVERVATAYWNGESPLDWGFDSRPEALIQGRVTIKKRWTSPS